MNRFRTMFDLFAAALLGAAAFAPYALAGEGAVAGRGGLEIVEVSAFKDGHALILAKGNVVPGEDGWFHWREVPAPLIGGFYAFAAEKGVRLVSVRTQTLEEEETVPASGLVEFIEANRGKKATLVAEEADGKTVSRGGTLVKVLRREWRERVARPTGRTVDAWGRVVDPGSRSRTGAVEVEETRRAGGRYLVLADDAGTELVEISRIRSLRVAGEAALSLTKKREVRVLSFRFAGDPARLKKPCPLAVVFLERGVRWIPDYRIDLGDDGKASLRLQGTVINDVHDLNDVKLNLVVGVPNFIMKDTLSPMAPREAPAALSRYFRPAHAGGSTPAFWNFASNSLMSQQVSFAGNGAARGGGSGIEGSGVTADAAADLFIYSVEGVTLGKGERAVVDVFRTEAAYVDRYVWNVAPLPPPELLRHINANRHREIAALRTASKVKHVVVLTNRSGQPWTTGPALLFRKGVFLAQELLTYTSAGNEVELPITVAVDVQGKKTEKEIDRKYNCLTLNNRNLSRVTYRGTLDVTNFRKGPVDLRIRRVVFGTASTASDGGKIHSAPLQEAFEDPALLGYSGWGRNPWFRWWNGWPYWWQHVNPVSVVEWRLALKPGEKKSVSYEYYYHFDD
jgi:hypothetical protein